MIGDGYLEVTDTESAAVARRLLDSGVANPRPRLLPSPDQLTVVVPCRDNADGLERLLTALRGHTVVVVDDGSQQPIRIPAGGRVSVLRHDSARGAVAARNAGLRAATTEFVAFVDSDVVPRVGWIEVMLGHFSDPEVALVAPRIIAREPLDTVLGRYERARSALDLGPRETAVGTRGLISHVPGAALLVRRSAVLAAGGFDERMRAAADIDLCWRLERSGWRLRYEPAARMACDQPVTFREWFADKVSRGAVLAPLARRYGGTVAPLSVPPSTAVATALLATASRIGMIGGILTLVVALLRWRREFTGVDNPTRAAAAHLTRAYCGGVWRIVSVLCREYWPVTALAMLVSRRFRRIALAMAATDGLADWLAHYQRGGLGPTRYLLCKRLDDLAYGTGVWAGACRARDLTVLRPAGF